MPNAGVDIRKLAGLIRADLEGSRAENALPVLDEQGRFTGQYYDQREEAPPNQPRPQRLSEHLSYLESSNPTRFVLQPGQSVPGFNLAEPKESYESDGLLNSAANVAKMAFNESLTGKAYEAVRGAPSYDLEGFQPSTAEQVVAGIGSFLMPVDLLTMMGTGGAAGLGVKALVRGAMSKSIAKKVAGGMAEKAARRMARKEFGTLAARIGTSIPAPATAFGAYEGLREALDSTVRRGEFDLADFLHEGIEGFSKGAALGAAMGAGGAAVAPLGKAAGLLTEVGILGTGSPFLEGRTPEVEDYTNAAMFIVGIKAAMGIPSGLNKLGRRARERFAKMSEDEKQIVRQNEVNDIRDNLKAQAEKAGGDPEKAFNAAVEEEIVSVFSKEPFDAYRRAQITDAFQAGDVNRTPQAGEKLRQRLALQEKLSAPAKGGRIKPEVERRAEVFMEPTDFERDLTRVQSPSGAAELKLRLALEEKQLAAIKTAKPTLEFAKDKKLKAGQVMFRLKPDHLEAVQGMKGELEKGVGNINLSDVRGRKDRIEGGYDYEGEIGRGKTGETLFLSDMEMSITAPYWRNKGYPFAEMRGVVDRVVAGEPITGRQAKILKDMYRDAKKYADEAGRAIPEQTANLKLDVGDELRIGGEWHRVTERSAEGELTIADGRVYQIDEVFDKIPVDRNAKGQPKIARNVPEEKTKVTDIKQRQAEETARFELEMSEGDKAMRDAQGAAAEASRQKRIDAIRAAEAPTVTTEPTPAGEQFTIAGGRQVPTTKIRSTGKAVAPAPAQADLLSPDKIKRGNLAQDQLSITTIVGEGPKELKIGDAGRLREIEGKDGKTILQLGDAASTAVVERAMQYAARKGKSLYVGGEFAKSKLFESMKKEGLIETKTVANREKVVFSEDFLRKAQAAKAHIGSLAASQLATLKARVAARSLGDRALAVVGRGIEAITEPLMQVRNRVKTVEGKGPLAMIEKAQETAHNMAGKYIEDLRRILVARYGEKGAKDYMRSGKLAAALDPELAKAAGVKGAPKADPEVKALLDRFYADLTSALKEGGADRAVIPDYIDRYFPRMIQGEIAEKLWGDLASLEKHLQGVGSWSDAAVKARLLSKNQWAKEAIEHLIKTGQAKDLRDALRKLNWQVKGQLFPTPAFAKSRTIKLPSSFYEVDAEVVLAQYFDSMAKWAADTKIMGYKGEKALKLLAKVAETSQSEFDLLHRLLRIHTGEYEMAHGPTGNIRKALQIYQAFEVGSKIGLGRAALLNLTQPAISFIPDLGVWNSLRAGLNLLKNPEARSRVRSTGVLLDSTLLAMIGQQPAGRIGKVANMLTKASGFQGINKALMMWSAEAINVAVPRWVRAASGTGPTAKWAQKRLGDFGIDYKKPVGENKMREVMFRFATDSQLQRNITREPWWFNTPYGRPLVLFKRFGYRQFTYIKDMMTREFKRGNIMPALRLGAAGVIGAEGVVWALNTIKSSLSGEPAYRKDDSLGERMRENLAIIGAFGFASDLMELDELSRLGQKVKFAAFPVVAFDIENVLKGVDSFTADWERYGDAWLATKRNAYHAFDVFGSLPRFAGKRLLTDPQEARRQQYFRTQEKNEVLKLIVDGHGEAAADRVEKWNKAYPADLAITRTDTSMKAVLDYLTRQMDKRLEAGEGDSATRKHELANLRIQLKELRRRGQTDGR